MEMRICVCVRDRMFVYVENWRGRRGGMGGVTNHQPKVPWSNPVCVCVCVFFFYMCVCMCVHACVFLGVVFVIHISYSVVV